MKTSTALLTAGALLAFAANSLLARAALGNGLAGPGAYTAARMASGALVLLLLSRAGPGRRPGGGSWGSAAAIAAYGIAFSLAYVRIPAGVGALVLFLAVQATMVGWAVLRGERPRRGQWLGMALALGGLGVLALPGARAPDPVGTALMAVSGAAWGVYTLRARAGVDPVSANADNFLRSLPVLLAFAALGLPGPALSRAGLALAVASGAVATAGGYILWYLAAPRLGATRAATVQIAVPLLAGAGGVLLLGEPPSARLIAAGAAILGGIALAAAPPRAAGAGAPGPGDVESG